MTRLVVGLAMTWAGPTMMQARMRVQYAGPIADTSSATTVPP